MCFLPLCGCVCGFLWKLEEDVGLPETGVTGYYESPKVGTGNYSYSLQQQQALLTTEIALQFHALICCCCCIFST